MDSKEKLRIADRETDTEILDLGQASVVTQGCLGPLFDVIFNMPFSRLDRD